eukprot:1050144-Amphidinium_carterae.1
MMRTVLHTFLSFIQITLFLNKYGSSSMFVKVGEFRLRNFAALLLKECWEDVILILSKPRVPFYAMVKERKNKNT